MAKEILDADSGIILGLLEDLHRLNDGLPPKKRGKNYHRGGPYFGKNYRMVPFTNNEIFPSYSQSILGYSPKKPTIQSFASPRANIGIATPSSQSSSRFLLLSPKNE